MNKSEKRQNAANLLVVPYGATPQQANAAYRKRILQCKKILEFNESVKVEKALYDAKQLMQYPVSQQWRAELKRKALPKIHILNEFIENMSVFCDEYPNTPDIEITLKAIEYAKDYKSKLKQIVGLGTYEMTALWGMMAYDHIAEKPNPMVGMIVYGSMILGGFALAYAVDARDKAASNFMSLQQKIKSR